MIHPKFRTTNRHLQSAGLSQSHLPMKFSCVLNLGGNNEGSIYQKSRGKWRAQLSLQGKRLSFTGESQKECQTWIKDTLFKIDSGMTYKDSKTILEQFMSDWLTMLWKASILRQKTHRNYTQLTTDYIIPEIGSLRLVNLKPGQIQAMYAKLINSGKGLRTVEFVHSILRGSLNHALRTGAINWNPTIAVIPPKPRIRNIQVLDSNQIQTFLINALNEQPRFFPMYQLAITTGMRMGELLGLKWEDVNWQKLSIRISRQLQPDPEKGFQFLPPKTKSGNRTVILGENTINILKTHKLSTDTDYACENQFQGLVFSGKSGRPIGSKKVHTMFKHILKISNIPDIRFHDLRHTAATQMITNGVDILTVAKRLGHAITSITQDIYAHAVPGLQDKAARIMDEINTPVSLPQELIAPNCTRNKSTGNWKKF